MSSLLSEGPGLVTFYISSNHLAKETTLAWFWITMTDTNDSTSITGQELENKKEHSVCFPLPNNIATLRKYRSSMGTVESRQHICFEQFAINLTLRCIS